MQLVLVLLMLFGCSNINSDSDEKYLSALLLVRSEVGFQECIPIERKINEEYFDLVDDVKILGENRSITQVKGFKDLLSFTVKKQVSVVTFNIKLKEIPSSGIIYSESFNNLVSKYEFQISHDENNIYTIGIEKKYSEKENSWNLKEAKPIVRKNSKNEFLCDKAIVSENMITFSCDLGIGILKNIIDSEMNIKVNAIHLDSGKVFSDCI
ncbi:hypothetical protein EHQ46_05960 [Leptospira yanagawae]|uniref:Lipoprotein n=1 Tax=Leptospira yanagawae TaxID=293069 RepID=A0ABY2M567_9LEPT|nr:hypothetical protein [Leptospira yanagawae]TGL23060.1 hypothetical protein EHQ46_05960 [Leptospira yanagawae]